MGGRGSGGGRSGGGGGSKAKVTTEKKEEKPLTKEEILKQKRLDALAKARAKRAENLKNGVKTEKKPRKPKVKMSMDSTVSDLQYELMRNVVSEGSIRRSDFRVEDMGNVVSVSVRYLGKWKNPHKYEEDYDWQFLQRSSGKQIDKVVKRLSKASGRKISWGASEKNWVDFDIPKAEGDK